MLLLLSLSACDKGSLVIVDDTGIPQVEDSTPPEPLADFSQYTATLDWTFDTWGDQYDCTDRSNEVATALTAEDPDYDGLHAACPLCTHFYASTLDNAEVCGWINIYETDWRGFVLGEDSAQVYRFDRKDDGLFDETLLDNNASFDGWTVSFDAEFSIWSQPLTVVGMVSFPEE